ncbi:MAG: DUF4249 domain-containing protein [Sphingomonadales bacterium]|nr:DUF4249 domain-containing protein [Sphingomonadales bacterium]
MKARFLSLFLIIGATGLSGCRETLIGVPDINFPPRIVVGCFIDPSYDTLTATLSLSMPLYEAGDEENFRGITDGIILLEGAGVTDTFRYDHVRRHYRLPATAVPILPDSSYTLKVYRGSSDTLLLAQARCTIPPVRDPQVELTAERDSSAPTPFYREFLNLDVRWPAQAAPERYFRMLYGLKHRSPTDSAISWINDAPGKPQVFTGTDATDGWIRVSDRFVFWGWGSPTGGITRAIVCVQETDVHSFRYLNALNAQINQPPGPFKEGVLLYSNIEGGLGCFGASNTYFVESPDL